MALDVDDQGTFLVADGPLSADGLHMQGILAAGEILEGHAVGQCVTIAPVVILALHPVHELETLALVVVSCCELDGEGVLALSQFEPVGLVECLGEHHTALILVPRDDLLLSDVQLGEHHAGKGGLFVRGLLQHPVHTIESSEQHVTVLPGHNGTGVELVALQTVGRRIVVEAEVV